MSRARIVVDLGFGDAGKGTMVDFFAQNAQNPLVIRANGGAQAAHNVVMPDGRHHTFSQFGSGSFVRHARTFYSRFALFDPFALFAEAEVLEKVVGGNPFARFHLDPRAVVVTPFHRTMNRIREVARGTARHGTCGVGIGETMYASLTAPEFTLYAGDLRDPFLTRSKLERVREWKRTEALMLLANVSEETLRGEMRIFETDAETDRIAHAFYSIASRISLVDEGIIKRHDGELLFEGAQGVLLDEWHGFHPHTTWSKTNADNPRSLIRESGFEGDVETIGVIRSYMTRHGEGPFPTEDARVTHREPHNGDGGWQGRFRRGWLDAVLTRYAVEATEGVTSLAMTHLDVLPPSGRVPVAIEYEREDGHIDRVGSLRALPRGGPLDAQSRLTEYLEKCAPVYLPVEYADRRDYAAAVGDLVGVDLRYLSYGPAATQKHVL